MTDDREIVIAALRWHTAREGRLEAGRQKRNIEALENGRNLSIHCKASLRVTELKRRELASLRALAKACAVHRGYLGRAEDAITVQFLEMTCI